MALNPKQFGSQEIEHTSPYVWVGSEPYDRSEIHEAAGFPGRTPEYALQKHKARIAKKNMKGTME